MTETQIEESYGLTRQEALAMLKKGSAAQDLMGKPLFEVWAVWRLTGSKLAAAEMRRGKTPQASPAHPRR